MKVFRYGRADLCGKFTSQRKDHILGWNHSNFMKQGQDVCGICSGIQGKTQNTRVRFLESVFHITPSQ
jgi:hypothetical protein